MKRILGATLLALASAGLLADEASVKKAMESKLGARIDSVTRAEFLGLYEVFVDGEIYYTDDAVSAIIVRGKMIDAKTMRNVTDERLTRLTAIRFADLPLKQAIKQVRGNGERVLVSFEDPNCGYCKRLARELQKLNNVTHYIFLYPILSEDSLRKSKQIWCAQDRSRAWNEWMVDGKAPPSKDDCDTTAVTRNQEYGRKLGINGTPTLFFANGERVPGAMPLASIEKKLNEAK